MPLAFTRARVQANRAIGKEIVPFAVASIEIRGGGACADEEESAFFIHTCAAPVIGCAGDLPGFAFPRFMPEFTWTRDRVKAPKLFPGPHVECARIAGSKAAAFRT